MICKNCGEEIRSGFIENWVHVKTGWSPCWKVQLKAEPLLEEKTK